MYLNANTFLIILEKYTFFVYTKYRNSKWG